MRDVLLLRDLGLAVLLLEQRDEAGLFLLLRGTGFRDRRRLGHALALDAEHDAVPGLRILVRAAALEREPRRGGGDRHHARSSDFRAVLHHDADVAFGEALLAAGVDVEAIRGHVADTADDVLLLRQERGAEEEGEDEGSHDYSLPSSWQS